MKTRRGMVEYGNPFCFYAVEPELGAYQTGDWCHRMAQVQRVNAGEKMHRRTEVIMHRAGPPAGAPLSSSIDQPAFPSRPGITLATARSVGDGRSGATRSSASMASTGPSSQ